MPKSELVMTTTHLPNTKDLASGNLKPLKQMRRSLKKKKRRRMRMIRINHVNYTMVLSHGQCVHRDHFQSME